MTRQVWPSRAHVIAQILDVAEPYALGYDAEHPEDIAGALIVAIEVAWRAVKPLDVDA